MIGNIWVRTVTGNVTPAGFWGPLTQDINLGCIVSFQEKIVRDRGIGILFEWASKDGGHRECEQLNDKQQHFGVIASVFKEYAPGYQLDQRCEG